MSALGIALIAASLFFKISVFPFQLWVPDVYQGSPTPVTALMATGTKAAAFAFLLNITFLLPDQAALSVAILALITMAVGNLGALVQEDVKRMLAYSGIAHAGTLLLAIAAALAGSGDLDLDRAARDAALFYMGAYLFTAAGAFGLIALVEKQSDGSATLTSLRGLARRRPGVAAAMTLFMLSLGGIPATGGFLGKWMVFVAAVDCRPDRRCDPRRPALRRRARLLPTRHHRDVHAARGAHRARELDGSLPLDDRRNRVRDLRSLDGRPTRLVPQSTLTVGLEGV